ncbi:MAG: DNA mismatch repair endonuclease MutL [Holophagales bacterium]|jgi:DNA mismatch repair protein MutL|nr:DNA mismatch repair endonuclease MutL [Holophagales bacterium]
MTGTSRIRILPDNVANQIAAGEVVERPASVLKELVENALDARAASLEITWEQGGRKLLEVADDGCGMAKDDLYLALERHATSKIKSAQDLQALESFGFRGEALPSIASVTRFELHSAESDGQGYKLRSEFGVIREVTPMPRARGTTVTIRDIFAQLPARRQFLKSADTEHSHLWATITRLALAVPGVRWAIRSDKSGALILPVAQDLKQRVAMLLGEKMTRLTAFSDGEAPWRVHGYISPPDLSYRDRNHLYLFVNGRPVRDRLMLSALVSGWDGFFPKGAYPAVVLFLELPPEAVDVNVHPTKAEVRFREPQKVFPWISQATREAWGAAKGELPSVLSLPPKPVYQDFDAPEKRPGMAQEHRRLWEVRSNSNSEALESMRQVFSPDLDRPYDYLTPGMRVAEKPVADTTGALPVRYLGAFSGTYILAEFRSENAPELWIVDQHAAHERVLYEKLFLRKRLPAVQPLTPPKIISIGRAAMARLHPFLEELCNIGVEVEAFGEDAITVRALPDFLTDRDPESLVEDLLAKMEQGGCPDLDHFRKDINAELACRAAIKKNHALDHLQAQTLLESLISCQTPQTCPHGRPIIKRMTLRELEQSFGRR